MCIIVRVRVKLIAVAEKYHNDRFRIFITASYIVHSTRCNGIWVKVSNWQITEYQVRLVVSEQHKETNTSQTIQYLSPTAQSVWKQIYLLFVLIWVYYLWSVCTLDLYIGLCIALTFIDDSIFLFIWNENTIECHYSTIKTTTMIQQNSMCCK